MKTEARISDFEVMDAMERIGVSDFEVCHNLAVAVLMDAKGVRSERADVFGLSPPMPLPPYEMWRDISARETVIIQTLPSG